MADVSHRGTDLAGHPDTMEMRARYSRVMGGQDVTLVDAPVFLAGLYLAISPWVVNFTASQPTLVIHNLIVGVAVGLLALGFAVAPERMYGLGWGLCAIGAWLVVSPWVVGSSPDAGVIWNQVVTGGVIFLLGIVGAALLLQGRRGTR
ncbi:SPW repeat protein [Streptomyces sodiiphilus]|uniref:SPW repeat protein n=1 Tax=Streptomyces sodiiphilus TaxID=226217 RepID=A0ABN2NR24_9ACTN